MTIFAETERLLLRELLPTDVQGMFDLDSDKDVHTFLGKQPISTPEQAQETIGFIRQQYIDHGIGRWAVIEKSTGNFIGWTGLKLINEPINNHIDYYDLGYRFLKRYWGKGYATETATASLKYAFEQLSQETVYAITDVRNVASKNVLEKVGLKIVECFDLNYIPHYWFQITKVEWLEIK